MQQSFVDYTAAVLRRMSCLKAVQTSTERKLAMKAAFGLFQLYIDYLNEETHALPAVFAMPMGSACKKINGTDTCACESLSSNNSTEATWH